jgi:hypothetical protein
MAWHTDYYEHLDDLQAALQRFENFGNSPRQGLWGFRGTARDWPRSTPLFDRVCPKSISYQNRLELEKTILKELAARLHIPIIPPATFVQTRYLITLALMQHHRAPTRLLDWTASARIAAFFACAPTSAEDLSHDGVIWMFDKRALEESADHHWGRWTRCIGQQRYAEGFEEALFDPMPERWLCPLYLNLGEALPPKLAGAPTKTKRELDRAIKRIDSQKAFFTVAGGSHLDHLDLIDRVTPESSPAQAKRKIIIAASLKTHILEWLDAGNINASELFPGLDGVGMRVAHRLFGTAVD